MLCVAMNKKLHQLDKQRGRELLRNTKLPMPFFHIIWAIGNVAK
jgi:hypothetical protein